MWQPTSAILVGAALIAFLFVFRLGTLVPGSAAIENQTIQSSATVQDILNNPVNAPYKATHLLISRVSDDILVHRLVNVSISLIVIILFYLLAKRLFVPHTATLATALFATSSVLLHTGRLATPHSMLLMLFVLIACGYALRFSTNNAWAWILASLAAGISLYVPGMIYFLIAGCIWQLKALQRPFGSTRPLLLISCFAILAAALTPIVFALVREPQLWRSFLGIPASFASPFEMLKDILAVPLGLFAFAPENPVFRLGKQPILEIFSGGMFLIGAYALLRKSRLDRSRLLAGIFILGTVWIGISGNFENSLILLPFAYLVVAEGIGWMLKEWYRVFPRNPLARISAVALITVAVIFAGGFQLRRYFIAWPNNPETVAVFQRTE